MDVDIKLKASKFDSRLTYIFVVVCCLNIYSERHFWDSKIYTRQKSREWMFISNAVSSVIWVLNGFLNVKMHLD